MLYFTFTLLLPYGIASPAQNQAFPVGAVLDRHGTRQRGADVVVDDGFTPQGRRIGRHRRRPRDGARTPRRGPQRPSVERQMPPHFPSPR